MDALAKNAWRTKIAELAQLMLGSQPTPGVFMYAILMEENETGIHALTFAHGHMESNTILITAHNALLDIVRDKKRSTIQRWIDGWLRRSERGLDKPRHWWQRR